MVDLDTLEHRRIELSSIKENGPGYVAKLSQFIQTRVTSYNLRGSGLIIVQTSLRKQS